MHMSVAFAEGAEQAIIDGKEIGEAPCRRHSRCNRTMSSTCVRHGVTAGAQHGECKQDWTSRCHLDGICTMKHSIDRLIQPVNADDGAVACLRCDRSILYWMKSTTSSAVVAQLELPAEEGAEVHAVDGERIDISESHAGRFQHNSP